MSARDTSAASVAERGRDMAEIIDALYGEGWDDLAAKADRVRQSLDALAADLAHVTAERDAARAQFVALAKGGAS